MPAVMALLGAHNLTLANIDTLGVGVGPGSFTGSRVAVASAQGIALGGPVTLKAMDSMALMALQAGPGLWQVALDARLGEVYSGCYQVSDQLEVVSAPGLMSAQALVLAPNAQPLGDGWALVDVAATDVATGAVCIAWQAYLTELPQCTPETLVPVYLRETVNWKKRVDQPSPLSK